MKYTYGCDVHTQFQLTKIHRSKRLELKFVIYYEKVHERSCILEVDIQAMPSILRLCYGPFQNSLNTLLKVSMQAAFS